MEEEYPTEEQLAEIQNWDCITYMGAVKLAEYICALWHYGEPYCSIRGKYVKVLKLSTGGWSGNEDIMAALNKNFLFRRYFYSLHAGGHYVYKIRK